MGQIKPNSSLQVYSVMAQEREAASRQESGINSKNLNVYIILCSGKTYLQQLRKEDTMPRKSVVF